MSIEKVSSSKEPIGSITSSVSAAVLRFQDGIAKLLGTNAKRLSGTVAVAGLVVGGIGAALVSQVAIGIGATLFTLGGGDYVLTKTMERMAGSKYIRPANSRA